MKIKAFSSLRSNEALENEGKWAIIVPGVEMKIRRLRSKVVQDARRKIYGPHERAMNGKDLPEKLETQLTIKLLGEAIVVDWRGDQMVDEGGKQVPFTPENAEAVFGEPETGKDLRALVLNFSNNGEFYAPEDVAVDEGN